MQVYNDELYHYGKVGMKWGKRSANISVKPLSGNKTVSPKSKSTTTKKKTAKEHKEAGAKHVGRALKILGANLERAHTLHDANRISKMVFPD